MLARITAAAAMAGLLTLSGCGPAKLDESRNWTLDPGGDSTRALDLPAQSKPQVLTVDFESSAAEVNVGVFKDADAAKLDDVPWTKAIKAETGKKSGTFTADVPANTATRVVVGNTTKKTEVKVQVTNRKK